MGEKRVTQQVASDEIYNDDWFLKDSVLHDTTKVQPSVIKEYVNQGMATSQDLADEATARQNMDSQLASGIGQQMANLADFYDTTKSYVAGDVCVLQSGELMRCTSPTSGIFDNTKWEQVTVDELFDDLNFSADAISYDNTSSGLEAENVQDAIGETITKLSAVGTASGVIATFTDGSDLPMPKLEVAIEPQQEGSGDPSPENIRPIIGWDEVNVTVADDTTDPTTENVYTIDLDGTRYGGKVDLVSGVMTLTHGFVVIDNTITSNKVSIQFSTGVLTVVRVVTGMPAVNDNNQICNIATYNTNAWQSSGSENVFVMGGEGNVYLRVSSSLITTQSDALTFFANTPMQIVYELATPLTIQLSPTVVKSLRGMNNVLADSGAILDAEYVRDLTTIINYILEQLGN